MTGALPEENDSAAELSAMPLLQIGFCGEVYRPKPDEIFTIGREGHLVIDDSNSFLHRNFLSIHFENSLWWLMNIGTSLSATIAAQSGVLQGWLSPGAKIPLVFESAVVWFTAGPTTYDFDITLENGPFTSGLQLKSNSTDTTIGGVNLTPSQRLLVVALAENVLRKSLTGAASIPISIQVAQRLGWPITKFNRKLDNVCEKFAAVGVRGLHGAPGRLATSRKARLVEYVVGAGIVTRADLALLDVTDGTADSLAAGTRSFSSRDVS